MIDIDKALKILKKEVKHYDVPVVDLIQVQTEDPFKVLIATILSARTKDETTAVVAKKIFSKISNFADLSKYSITQLEKLVYPVGFYKNKARFLKALPNTINEKFNGTIPSTVEELIQLPGVGRKTANLVVAVAYNKPAICVDTHVHRIMNIWEYVRTKNPLETEMTLRQKLPIKYWTTVNSILVAFGQNKCRPVSPYCSTCPISKICPKFGIDRHR